MGQIPLPLLPLETFVFVAVDSCFSLFIKRKKEKKILSPPCLKHSVRKGPDIAPASRGAAVAWQLFPTPLEHPTVEKSLSLSIGLGLSLLEAK